MSNFPEILTLQQAAAMLQVSERTIQRMVKRGEIPGTRIGGQWRFDRDQLRAMVRGEWTRPPADYSDIELIERESLRLGVDVPETLIDLQQIAKKRLDESPDD